MKNIGYIFIGFCLIVQFVYIDLLPTVSSNVFKEEEVGDLSRVIYKDMKDDITDDEKIYENFGHHFDDIELFICDSNNEHCDFIKNVSLASDNNLDCYHLYTKIYLTIFDVFAQKAITFLAYIPNHNGSQINQIAGVVKDQVVSETCHHVLK